MSKYLLQTKMKSKTGAYLCYLFLFSSHYAYLGRWGLQFLYWFTLGGALVWTIIDLFRIPGMVGRHNARIAAQLEDLERKEKEELHSRNLALIAASKNL